jgi:hypothetical protein
MACSHCHLVCHSQCVGRASSVPCFSLPQWFPLASRAPSLSVVFAGSTGVHALHPPAAGGSGGSGGVPPPPPPPPPPPLDEVPSGEGGSVDGATPAGGRRPPPPPRTQDHGPGGHQLGAVPKFPRPSHSTRTAGPGGVGSAAAALAPRPAFVPPPPPPAGVKGPVSPGAAGGSPKSGQDAGLGSEAGAEAGPAGVSPPPPQSRTPSAELAPLVIPPPPPPPPPPTAAARDALPSSVGPVLIGLLAQGTWLVLQPVADTASLWVEDLQNCLEDLSDPAANQRVVIRGDTGVPPPAYTGLGDVASPTGSAGVGSPLGLASPLPLGAGEDGSGAGGMSGSSSAMQAAQGGARPNMSTPMLLASPVSVGSSSSGAVAGASSSSASRLRRVTMMGRSLPSKVEVDLGM